MSTIIKLTDKNVTDKNKASVKVGAKHLFKHQNNSFLPFIDKFFFYMKNKGHLIGKFIINFEFDNNVSCSSYTQYK